VVRTDDEHALTGERPAGREGVPHALGTEFGDDDVRLQAMLREALGGGRSDGA
jgi:hypothetical protein